MRLGTTLMAVGIVLTLIGLGLGTTTTTTETVCESTYYGPNCQTVESEEPALAGPLFLLTGSFLFGGGWGGWVGTYDSDKRLEKRLEDLHAAPEPTDD